MQNACATCGQSVDEVRAEVEAHVDRLMRLQAALAESTHVYADYERTRVEQELGGYGIDLHDLPPDPPERGARKKRR
jgi:hypothetical protein